MAADTVTEEDCGAGGCCASAPQIPRSNKTGRIPPSNSARAIDQRFACRVVLGIDRAPFFQTSPLLSYCCGFGSGLGGGVAGGVADDPGAGAALGAGAGAGFDGSGGSICFNCGYSSSMPHSTCITIFWSICMPAVCDSRLTSDISFTMRWPIGDS